MGRFKKDLLKSIELYPSKKAYLLLVHIEEQTSCNKNKIKNWLDLAKDCEINCGNATFVHFEQKNGV